MIRLPQLARHLAALFADRRAATAVEYGLIAALIVLAALASIRMVANATITMWNGVSANVVGPR